MNSIGEPLPLPAQNPALQNAKLLIVDDEPMNVLLLRDMLEHSAYQNIQSTSDSREVLAIYKAFAPDLILLDLMMPHMDGIAVMELLRTAEPNGIAAPILVLTADISPQARRRALSKGAKDFLNKPFDAVELLLRINNLLETRFLHLDLQWQNHSLENRVLARTAELEAARQKIANNAEQLERAQLETLDRLAKASDFHDDETGEHSTRVSITAALLAQHLGFAPDRIRWISQAARLHDVGKIGISDQILLKPGRFTVEEFAVMQTHTTIGARLLEGGQSELMKLAQQIAQSHHERWDGSGYPQGLSGEDIPIAARLLAVADVFDALTHTRPYKSAWSVPDAVAEVVRQSGLHFDPNVVKAFLCLDHESLL